MRYLRIQTIKSIKGGNPVHKINCAEFDKHYVGQTKRNIYIYIYELN